MAALQSLGQRLRSWMRGERPAAPRPLRAQPFTDASLAVVPRAPGVYQLYRHGTLLYAGMARESLRRELQRHRSGELAVSALATGFGFDVTADPEAALRDYLRTYAASHGGRLPPGNGEHFP